ncbi:MAG: hypothetical protein LRY73_04120 [Bacillus sp. (in: Bacteria)]|nr:hypothetical protein [Bacillus sp. (in: firmicutes)]
MKKKLLLAMLAGMFTVGFLGACGEIDDDLDMDNDPIGEEGDGGLD